MSLSSLLIQVWIWYALPLVSWILFIQAIFTFDSELQNLVRRFCFYFLSFATQVVFHMSMYCFGVVFWGHATH